ncbi:Fe-S cluster assembly scaffold protein SufB (SufB) [Fructobacillus cardui]|uniref:SufB/SufD family protein n=1 Tax=Fructobacillus cardui TaxID=2893170 RepID=UPI002DB55420|nr:Fe-S cluster assembly scaffold protein SufB (SufB) [Fructobacillus cardui]
MKELTRQIAEELPLPDFPKVRFQHWGLTDLVSGQGQAEQPLMAQAGDAGVLLLPLKQAKQDYPDLVEQVYDRVAETKDRLTAENLQSANTGLFVYLPAGVTVTENLNLFLAHLGAEGDLVGRVVIYADQNSQARIVSQLETATAGISNVSLVIEVLAAAGAKLTMVNFDHLDQETTGFINRQAVVGNQAEVNWVNAAFNDGNVISQLTTKLVGEGAKSETKVAAFTARKQVQEVNTEIQNICQHTVGHIFQRGVILNRSSFIFNGIGRIIKGAKGSDVQQESRVLMLSRRARGEANQLLLIDESDVTAGHAASVGQVDDQQLYYLMSRGLPDLVARRLVVRGFVGEILAKIHDQKLESQAVAAIERKLNDENGTR